MSFLNRLVLVSAFASVASGCGTYVSSCDFRQGSSNGPEPRCQEMTAKLSETADSYRGACDIAGGIFIDGECPREGLVAGCREAPLLDGTTAVDWYYQSPTNEEGVLIVETRADVEAMCTQGEVVDP